MNELGIVVIFVGLLHYLIGSIINSENAKILLAGYNTMSKSERDKYDIEGYLNFFKPFFKKLGFYSVFLYFISSLAFDELISLIIWTLSQVIPLPYLIIKGKTFKKRLF